MRVLHLTIIIAVIVIVSANEDTKKRGKRQQIPYFVRRLGRPPPYAVQMEPIPQYSQRDPLYNPLANAKSDDIIYHDDPLGPYGPSEPEPIIEIIIKESNESLPTPVPPTLPPSRPTKEPIQVFYVKYEKKDQGDGKSRVIYEKPVPALVPHEEHEAIPDKSSPTYDVEPIEHTSPSPPEPSTTLRAIIRPESEVYHSGSSGIRVSFGTEQLPGNNHNKRNDVENASTASPPSSRVTTSPVSSSLSSSSLKKQRGPYPPLQSNHFRVPPAFGQQRILNSFPSYPQFPPNYPSQLQFSSPPPGHNGQRQPRPPITIQGLPEVHQRLSFQSFNAPNRISINHPQQPGFPPAISVSHQSIHLQNQPPPLLQSANFNGDSLHSHSNQQPPQHSHPQPPQHSQSLQHSQPPQHSQSLQHSQPPQHSQPSPHLHQQPQLDPHQQHQQQQQQQQHHQQQQQQQQQQQHQLQLYKQQEHEKQKYHEQRRQQELQKHREQSQRQQELQRHQEQQYQAERQRLQQIEQQRVKQQENKISQDQFQYNQQNNFAPPPEQSLQLAPNRGPQQPQRNEPRLPEVLKAVPKLEQHYSIHENPLQPGPFPSNPQTHSIQYSQSPQTNLPLAQQSSNIPAVHQQSLLSNAGNFGSKLSQSQSSNSVSKYQNHQSNQQSFFSQNLPSAHQYRGSSSLPTQSIWGQPVFKDSSKQKIFATPVPKTENYHSFSTPRPIVTYPSAYPSSTAVPTTTAATTTTTTTTTTETPVAPKNDERIKENIANLPDEVPDDIRDQLLSSGILGNADIQVLDYDKVGDIPIENLPPEALANFYGAGGGSVASAASAPVPAIAKRPKIIDDSSLTPKKATSTKVEQATLRPGGVEMKVVRFDPNTAQGQAIADQHIREDATHLKPVTVGAKDHDQYNRYLPLKVSGASFPIPDVPELKDRKISSVVVLAPVDYNFGEDDESRYARKLGEPMPVRFLAGESLKQLVKKPTAENYKKWLEQESRTEPQKQSVVLLVTTPKNPANGEKEIFMYDVASHSVSKLSGDLSSAFVDAAESNSESPDTIDDSSLTFTET